MNSDNEQAYINFCRRQREGECLQISVDKIKLSLKFYVMIKFEEKLTKEDLQKSVRAYEDVVDYIMFDTKIGSTWGGTGKTFDWSLLTDLDTEIPIFLSGGINTDNVREAIESVNPFGIDVSSSLEEEPGLKDFDKVEAFMDEMREIWANQELN